MTEYAVRVEHGGGSTNGDVIETFHDITDARDFLHNPPPVWAHARLAIYELTPCYEETP